MHTPEAFPAADLWAITCFFNPVGYRRRLQNFRVFRGRLNVPLVAVELSCGPDFELGPGDAEILIQLHGQDVMWQKERLLNIALAAVPPECQKVAWIDCDAVFENHDWATEASRRLDDYPLVQPFHEFYDLHATAGPCLDRRRAAPPVNGLAFQLAAGYSLDDALPLSPQVGRSRFFVGLACAFRREVFASRGFFTGGILGGDDRCMICAALGRLDVPPRIWSMNARQAQYYKEWAIPFYRDIQGQLGFIPGAAFHQWHGDVVDRRYSQRYADLVPFDFDPYLDVTLDANGVGYWSSDKPGMHRYVRSYFAARNEDGFPAMAPVYAHAG